MRKILDKIARKIYYKEKAKELSFAAIKFISPIGRCNMKHTDIKLIFAEPTKFAGQSLTVCGWVRTSRDSKNVAFVELNDGTTCKNLQIVIDKDKFAAETLNFPVGAGVKFVGKLVESEKNVCELQLESYQILGECPADYPLQKKRHTLEFLRTMPHLRVRTNTFVNVQRVRSALAFASHLYFQSHNFTYVHTPLITGSDCEGAGEVFRVTTKKWNDTAKTEEEYYATDFFGRQAFLTVSGQLEGETAAMALGKIYTFGPVFRAENSNTSRHAAEFWQVEPEVAFAELPDIIEIVEEYVKFIVDYVLKNCANEIAFFENFYEKGLTDKLNLLVNSEFKILEYTEAIEILKNAKDVTFEYAPEWGSELQSEHERYITEKVFKKPVFVINYPKDIKAFYMKQNPDGKTVAATDLLVPGIGEIVGCSEREADYDKLVQAMEARHMDISAYRQYLDLRKFGSVPHSGFGIGFDRMVMYVTGMSNIRDVLLYPRTSKELR